MVRIHVLSGGYGTPGGSAFLFPLRCFSKNILEVGIKLQIYFSISDKITECDILLVDSKFYRQKFPAHLEFILEDISDFKSKGPKVFWCDTNDSTGWLQHAVIPHVDMYLKCQLLRDRAEYSESWYGHRIFTNYYHHRHGVVDDDPIESPPITDEEHRRRLRVSWSLAFSNYTYSPIQHLLTDVRSRLGFPPSTSVPSAWISPNIARPIDVSARFGISYSRKTIRYQRELVRRTLNSRASTAKISRKEFVRELASSKTVISPFGWGEFAFRDYETFLAGSLLMKPDMSHMETWPDLYRDGETMVAFSWDVDDLNEKLDEIISNYQRFQPIAEAGQKAYQSALIGDRAAETFAERLRRIILDN